MADVTYAARLKDTGRNDDCPCGSGKKYKKCHLAADQEEDFKARQKSQAEAEAKAKAESEAREKAEKDTGEGAHIPEAAAKKLEHAHNGPAQHGAKSNQSHKPVGSPRKMV